MTMIILLGGACCLYVMVSGGMGLMYAMNKDFKAWVNGLFGGGDVSEDADKWVCPNNATYNQTTKDGVVWCQAGAGVPHTRASKLPKNAAKGSSWTRSSLVKEDGIYGPANGGYGKDFEDTFTYDAR